MAEDNKVQGRYQVYAEYKDSGVEWLGEIPSHWEVKRLGQFFKERREKVSDKDYPPLSVTMKGIVPQLENAAKSDAGDNRKLVLKNDFVINSRSDRKGSSGVSPYDGSVSLISIVLEPIRILPRYAHHLLRSYNFQEEFYRYGKGIVADLWSTNSSEMKNILIPEIPEDESLSIANFLDHETAKIDKLIEKQQTLIELLKEKRQATISHAVTKGLDPNVTMKDSGVEWLGEVPEHWEVTKVKYIAELTPSKSEVMPYLEKECSFVPMEKLKLDSLVLNETKVIKDVYQGYTYFQDGDILLAKVTPCFENQNMAIANGLVNGIGFGSSEIFVLRTKIKELNQFLYYRLQETVFMKLGAGAMTGAGGLQRVPSDFINNFQFALPPIKECKEIVNYIKDKQKTFDALIEKAEQAIQLMQERRTAVISSAVTGKIDVRGWEG